MLTLLAGIKEFLLKDLSLSVFTIQYWMLIAAAIVAIILVLVIISAVKHSKKNAKNTALDDSQEDAAPTESPEHNEGTDAVVENDEKEEVKDEKPVREEAPEKQEEPLPAENIVAEAPTEEPAQEEAEEIAEEETEEEIVAEEKKEPEKTAPKASSRREKTRYGGRVDSVFGSDSADKVSFDAKNDNKAADSEVAATVQQEEAEPETEAVATEEKKEQAKGVIGKFELCNSALGGFRYHLLANNGQLLYESRDYKVIDTCREAIAKFVNSVEKGAFSIKADKFGNYKYSLKSATSNNIIYVGESYTTKKSCESSVESVKRFAPISPIVDATNPDFVPTATHFAIPEETIAAVSNKQGAIGKWAIDRTDAEDPNSPFVFLLFANNGQLLYESRDYKSYDNCRKGVDAFVSAVENGYFIIAADKFGRYKFFLRSKKTGSQAEYVGQNYSDRASCESSAVSVYRFALLTPINLD